MIFFFNDTATTEIYTLSLHDALPIFTVSRSRCASRRIGRFLRLGLGVDLPAHLFHVQLADLLDQLVDRKSTRLNSSHANISYAVFCLKKKKTVGFCLNRCA